MADFRSNYWRGDYWESAVSNLEGFADSLAITNITNIAYVETLNSTYYKAILYPSGILEMWGSFGDYSATVTRIYASVQGEALDLRGNINTDGYYISGVLNSGDLKAYDYSSSFSGNFYIDSNLNIVAKNTTEVVQTSNYESLVKTNSSGDIYFARLDIGSNYITAEGNWAYDSYLSDVAFDGNDRLYGTTSADHFLGSKGSDIFYGESGDDLVQYRDAFANYSLGRFDSETIGVRHLNSTATYPDLFTDTLINIERIQFSDAVIAFDTEGATSAGGIYRLYQATFARTPDKEGYGFWLAAADTGLSAKRMAEDFTMSAEFQSLYGVNTTDPYFTGEDVGAMITGFYNNILGRDPDQSGYDFWVDVVENKIDTVGGVLTGFSESEENYNNTIGTIQNGMQYDLWAG